MSFCDLCGLGLFETRLIYLRCLSNLQRQQLGSLASAMIRVALVVKASSDMKG